MANPYRDKKGQFSSGGSGGKGASKGKTPNYAGFDYKGKEGKSFVVSDGTRTKYLNNKEFGEFSRQKLGFTSGKAKSASVMPVKPSGTADLDRARKLRKAVAMAGPAQRALAERMIDAAARKKARQAKPAKAPKK
jgi:hypothetical protein